eukprot:tig00020553_g10728.t1
MARTQQPYASAQQKSVSTSEHTSEQGEDLSRRPRGDGGRGEAAVHLSLGSRIPALPRRAPREERRPIYRLRGSRGAAAAHLSRRSSTRSALAAGAVGTHRRPISHFVHASPPFNAAPCATR